MTTSKYAAHCHPSRSGNILIIRSQGEKQEREFLSEMSTQGKYISCFTVIYPIKKIIELIKLASALCIKPLALFQTSALLATFTGCADGSFIVIFVVLEAANEQLYSTCIYNLALVWSCVLATWPRGRLFGWMVNVYDSDLQSGLRSLPGPSSPCYIHFIHTQPAVWRPCYCATPAGHSFWGCCSVSMLLFVFHLNDMAVGSGNRHEHNASRSAACIHSWIYTLCICDSMTNKT